MSNCLKCTYPPGEPKGERACRKCGRPENVPKGQWRANGRQVEVLPPVTGRSLPPLAVIEMPTVVSSEPTVECLPEHSPLGGSGAKRWMNCPGSTVIINRLGLVGDESDHASYGTLAHSIAQACLEREVDAWEIVGEYPDFKPEDAVYVQTYIDYVRSRPGRKRFEVFHHRPELHRYMYGQIDAEIVPITGVDDPGLVLEIVDLKFGEGQYVEVEGNEQGKYYACLVIMEDPDFFPDDGRVRITICQPRHTWAGPAIRSCEMTVGELKGWLHLELLPAMKREELSFEMGEWCRFCPAKLFCPAMQDAFETAATQAAFGDESKLGDLSDDDLSGRFAKAPFVRMYLKAIEAEVYKRLMDRRPIPSAKLVPGKSDRVWKDGAEDRARQVFGRLAYTEPRLLSPAQLEKLPAGANFVSEWAYKPEAGYVVASADDKRTGVTPKSGAELFSNTLKHLDA